MPPPSLSADGNGGGSESLLVLFLYPQCGQGMKSVSESSPEARYFTSLNGLPSAAVEVGWTYIKKNSVKLCLS